MPLALQDDAGNLRTVAQRLCHETDKAAALAPGMHWRLVSAASAPTEWNQWSPRAVRKYLVVDPQTF